MIVAGFILLAVGAADLVRQFAPIRWIGYLATAVLLLLLGSVSDAVLPMIAALLAGVAWVWCMPDGRPSPAGFWPAVLLALISVGAVIWIGDRGSAGLIGEVWQLRSPFGEVSFDLAILTLGLTAFLLESANLVVRAALDGEHTWRPIESAESAPEAAAPEAAPTEADPARDRRDAFQGGRLIGPLERMLVLILTLAAAYPILAAMLAAKGIVRFPEISRDGETGARAEYFLVGSLVSWVIALGAAFLVWWSAHS
ncbi:hypothetical protein SRABI76_01054 [Microbacterium oxydans]|uniref:Uncharacterized protein n=1 Tax=Microbacterium oxydans TaxID=82380 RepID=A0A0F0L9S9_9MICO|nr:hypothetical protein [Microbacterium oxydans]KJL29035.1 hypothetical protein RS83_02519 [Microbacterium oxydans]CAH0161741.1 hypothetical protein SRABI76_01054 [Microbacterium oxydans]